MLSAENRIVTNPDDPEIFQYCKPLFPDDCYHNVSPSSIGKFFDFPVLYYRENVLGEEQKFQGSTSTVLGSICHKIYELVVKYPNNKWKEFINREIIQEQLLKFVELHPELGINVDEVISLYPQITREVVNSYILKCTTSRVEVEKQVVVKLDDSIYLGGTIDRIEGDCVVDYKNVGKMPSDTTKIPFGYKIQLLAYAYALRKLGYIVDRIRIVYGIRPTKTIPARCVVVTEQIDYVANKLIDDTLNLIVESVTICKNRPELVHLIFKSWDLKK